MTVDAASDEPDPPDRAAMGAPSSLRFLERRDGSRAAAEDLLQDAFVKTLGRLDAVPGEALMPWFYTVVRNGVIDRARRIGRDDRGLAAPAQEPDATATPSRCETCHPPGAVVGAQKDYAADGGLDGGRSGRGYRCCVDVTGRTCQVKLVNIISSQV